MDHTAEILDAIEAGNVAFAGFKKSVYQRIENLEAKALRPNFGVRRPGGAYPHWRRERPRDEREPGRVRALPQDRRQAGTQEHVDRQRAGRRLRGAEGD